MAGHENSSCSQKMQQPTRINSLTSYRPRRTIRFAPRRSKTSNFLNAEGEVNALLSHVEQRIWNANTSDKATSARNEWLIKPVHS